MIVSPSFPTFQKKTVQTIFAGCYKMLHIYIHTEPGVDRIWKIYLYLIYFFRIYIYSWRYILIIITILIMIILYNNIYIYMYIYI